MMNTRPRICMKAAVALLVLAVWQSGSAQANDYHDIAVRFFSLVKEGKPAEAVDYIFATNSWLAKVPDQAANVRTQFVGLEALVGKHIDQEVLIDKEITSRYAYMYYLVAYERQPIKVEFHFYRPKGKWVLLNFYFNAEFSDDIVTFATSKEGAGKLTRN